MKGASPTLRNAFALLFCVALVSCDKPDEAPAFEGKTISKLTFRHTTPKYVQDSRLRSLMSSKVGDAYSADKVDDDIRILWESGLVDDARFLAEPDGQKVHLIAEVATRLGFGPPLFVGNTLFSDQLLSKQISEPLAGRIRRALNTEYDMVTDQEIVSGVSKFESKVLLLACGELERFYASRGVPGTKVELRLNDGDSASIGDFVFVITEPAGRR